MLGLCSMVTGWSQLQVYTLEEKADTQLLADYVMVWPDRAPNLPADIALAHWERGDFITWSLFREQLPSRFLRGKYYYWMMVALHNPMRDSFPALLLTRGDILYAERNISRESREQESRIAITHPPNHIYLTLAPGQTDTLLLQLFNPGLPADFIPVLLDQRTFFALETQQYVYLRLFYTFLIGILFSIFFFSGLMYFNLKNPAYLWYALYAASLVFIYWRNLEEIHSLIFSTYRIISWTTTKVFHTVFTIVSYFCFAYFLIGQQREWFRQGLKGLFMFVGVILIVEVTLLVQQAYYWSWLLYFGLRIVLTLAGLVFLLFLWKTPGKIAKLILSGSAALIFFEGISWAFIGTAASAVSGIGVCLEMVFFSIAIAYSVRLDLEDRGRLKMVAKQLELENTLQEERLRGRIAQDIHDDVGAELTKISLGTELVLHTSGHLSQEVEDRLRRIGTSARSAATSLREIIFTINPDYDQFSEMQAYYREYALEFFKDSGITLHLSFPDTSWSTENISAEVKRNLFLLYKEALNNIVKHAEAREVFIGLNLTPTLQYILDVQDDGLGFDRTRRRPNGRGIRNMEQRAQAIRASLVFTTAEGEGTQLCIEGPIYT